MQNRCRSCGNAMTWADQRRQYGRLIQRGLTPQATAELMPRCQKCVTTHLRDVINKDQDNAEPTSG
jgi:hypothetical protein